VATKSSALESSASAAETLVRMNPALIEWFWSPEDSEEQLAAVALAHLVSMIARTPDRVIGSA
jgi:hypothetical protein